MDVMGEIDLRALLAEALDNQKKITEALLLLTEQQTLKDKEYEWVTPEEAAAMLGSAFSSRKLVDDIKTGWFKSGYHYTNKSSGSRPSYAFRVGYLRKVYDTPLEKRKTYPVN